MNKGDIVEMPSGAPAMYLGAVLGHGAKFVYVDETGEPKRDPHDRRELDCFFIGSLRVLMKMQPEMA